MTQIATVERILDARHAEISVARQSACGHDCEQCAGCGVTGMKVRAKAVNPIGARPGEQVIVQSSTASLLGISAVVYLLPFALFLTGYLIALAAGVPVAVQYAAAVTGFAVGFVPAAVYERRLRAKGGLLFTIVRLF